MAPIRATEPAAATLPARPPFDDWLEGHLAIVENYGDLSKVPWSKLRTVEIFPGGRLDAKVFLIPEHMMAAGSLRRASSRTFEPAMAGIPADTERAIRRDECVRRALYALFLPGNGGRGVTVRKPSTFRLRAGAYLRFAAWQLENRPSEDGSVFGQLTLADLVSGFYPAMAQTKESRQSYQFMFNALLDAGQRGVISDYPRFFAEKIADQEYPVLEPVRQNAPVLEPAAQAAEPSVTPFPDEFVTEFVRRARWFQEDLADGLIEHFVRDREIREDFLERGYRVRDEIVSRARLEALRDVPWLDAAGAKITHLRYPIRQYLAEAGSVPSHSWPPSDIRTLPMDLVDLALGYALTCHRAQGSEADHVIVALPESRLIDPSWIYTAVTRARRSVVILGEEKTLRDALKRPFADEQRLVGLRWP